jgi:hypothetical protein
MTRGCISVLAAAAQRFNVTSVELLLQAGASVNGDLRKASRRASSHSLLELVLYSSGNRSSKQNNDQITVINLLLKAGMPTRDTVHGCSALVFCLSRDDVHNCDNILPYLAAHDPGLLELISNFSANPLASANDGATILHLMFDRSRNFYYDQGYLDQMFSKLLRDVYIGIYNGKYRYPASGDAGDVDGGGGEKAGKRKAGKRRRI